MRSSRRTTLVAASAFVLFVAALFSVRSFDFGDAGYHRDERLLVRPKAAQRPSAGSTAATAPLEPNESSKPNEATPERPREHVDLQLQNAPQSDASSPVAANVEVLVQVPPDDAELLARVATLTRKPASQPLRTLVQLAQQGRSTAELTAYIERDLEKDFIVQFEARKWLSRRGRSNGDGTSAKPSASDQLKSFGRGGGKRRVLQPVPSGDSRVNN